MVFEQSQIRLSGLKLRTQKRQTRHKCVFCYVIPYDLGIKAHNGGRVFWAVVSTFMSQIASIETLVSGFIKTKRSQMT